MDTPVWALPRRPATLPWSSHLHILSRAKRDEERQFYLRMAVQQRWPVRELARQIDGGLFERAVLNPPKLSTALRDSLPQPRQQFRDAYLLEFLALPEPHTEAELHGSLLRNLSRFLTELGRDFCYIGSVTAFAPERLGKLNFYLEALGRDVKKPHENPAIGVLLCASFTRADRALPDPAARQGAAAGQAARVLPSGRPAGGG